MHSKVYIQRTIRPKYVLKSQLQIENPYEQTFKVASLPSVPLKKCMAGSSLLTEIIIQKYLYHLPFHRIIQKFKDSGFVISNSTIGDWFAATCVKLRPLYDMIKEDILSTDYIQVDETTLPVISDEKSRAVKGYVWVVRNAVDGDVFFHYTNGSRSQSTARASSQNQLRCAAAHIRPSHGLLQCMMTALSVQNTGYAARQRFGDLAFWNLPNNLSFIYYGSPERP